MSTLDYYKNVPFELGSAIGFLSRADQGIGVFWHAAPPTSPDLTLEGQLGGQPRSHILRESQMLSSGREREG